MTQKKYKYDSAECQSYLDMLQKTGYLVLVRFDKSLRYYYHIEVFMEGQFLGKFPTPRKAWNKINMLNF